ncbi:hypothetical protein B1748_04810 [Paenibacillus sp. MY03]|uniref:hypothetical protein n=1 Tax=Paenibacillus sp. MY03 TaxID=302980 RepID=UPI000B3C2D32|nr:hypothetical protein [Paenibacillus sp. MY03]OUS78089.1 hypothetical protein B1748_04810 [Paenibacillus sp. MY03]
MNLTKLAAVQTIEFDIDIETTDIFDQQKSLEEARILIQELNERSLHENKQHKHIELADDYWELFNPIRGNSEDIDFSFINELDFIKHSKKGEIKNVLKCWTLDRLINDQLTAATVQTYFLHVKDSIILTNLFSASKVQSYVENIKSLLLADIVKNQIVSSVLNFLSFYNSITSVELFSEALYGLKSNLKLESKSRTIPSGLDILRFSSILEDYFSVTESKKIEYLHYFPILLWWKITTIIPLRPFEFCSIEPSCLITDNKKYYLKLPRIKGEKFYKRNVRRKQIVDRILVPTEIKDLIQEYNSLIDKFNHTSRKTFISREVYDLTLPSGESSHKRKRSNDSFLSTDLQNLLERFYKNVVKPKYGLSYTHIPPIGKKSIKDDSNNDADIVRVRPIDSRHIAFINMLAQGWSKPEIARFGGHLLLSTQASYQNHQEYWIEIETRKLMQYFKLGSKVFSAEDTNNKDSFIVTARIDSAFKKKFILKPPTTQFRKPLKIGYCTDEKQLCKTHCYHCKYWRLTVEELEERSDELKAFLSECDHNIAGLFAFLKDLNRFIFKDEELNPEIAENILSTQKKLDDEIFKRASFLYNVEQSQVN